MFLFLFFGSQRTLKKFLLIEFQIQILETGLLKLIKIDTWLPAVLVCNFREDSFLKKGLRVFMRKPTDFFKQPYDI